MWRRALDGLAEYKAFMDDTREGKRLSFGDLRTLNPMKQAGYIEHILLKNKETDEYVEEVQRLVKDLHDEIVAM